MNNNLPIGVFDSGIGGLNVLDDLVKAFPNENFLYLGDTLRSPYGIKAKKELHDVVESDIRYFERKNVKGIVIACNTATANSYDIKSNIPIIRIIEPTSKIAIKENAKFNKRNKIVVCATNYTISSLAYDAFLKNEMIGVPCSEWVVSIENGEMGTKKALDLVKEKLLSFKDMVDVVVLGCTHFALFRKEIIEVLGDKVVLVDSATSLKQSVKELLDKCGYNKGMGKVDITFTGELKKLKLDAFKNSNLDFSKIKKVNIED